MAKGPRDNWRINKSEPGYIPEDQEHLWPSTGEWNSCAFIPDAETLAKKRAQARFEETEEEWRARVWAKKKADREAEEELEEKPVIEREEEPVALSKPLIDPAPKRPRGRPPKVVANAAADIVHPE